MATERQKLSVLGIFLADAAQGRKLEWAFGK